MLDSVLRENWYLTVVALLLFASQTFALGIGQQVSITFGTGNSTVVGDVEVDPYTATVGGAAMTVICDDWSDNVSSGETWNANVIGLTPLSGGTPLFGNNQVLYNEIAYLSADLLANTSNPDQEAGISFALWELTYPYAPFPDGTSPAAYLTQYGTASQIADYNTAYGNATTIGASSSYSGFEILTPATVVKGEPQEFIVYTPECSTVRLLGADMVGLLGLVFLLRRRTFRPVQ